MVNTISRILLFISFILWTTFIQGCNANNDPASKKGIGRPVSLLQQQQNFNNEDRVAVIVGIDQYDSYSGLNSLHYAVADAKALKEAFEKQGYKIKLLLNNDAKKSYILDAITAAGELLKNPTGKPQGTLVFIFTGHGFSDEQQQNYLAVDGTTINRLSSSGLSLAKVKEEIRKSGARRSMLFIDACRDKPTRGTKSISNPSFSELKDSEGLNILLSTNKNNVSYEDHQLKHGVFSYYLLEGLKGKAALDNGLLLFDNLANYVTKKVKGYTYEHLPKVQKPFRLGESSGQFLVATLPRSKKAIDQKIEAKQTNKKVVIETQNKTEQKPANNNKLDASSIKPINSDNSTATANIENTDNDKQLLELAFKQLNNTTTQEQAIKTFKILANKGNAIALARLARSYLQGTHGLEKDKKRAEQLAQQALENGLEKQAEQEHIAYAQYTLGALYYEGLILEKNLHKAFTLMRNEVKDNPNTVLPKTFLGAMYDYGIGVKKDKKQAVKWYRKAAEQGDALAQNNLGWMYYNGKGVNKDKKQAVKWYRKAAEQGNALAQFNLGVMYSNGEGVKKDKKQSVKWYHKAAEQGNTAAQFKLGVMYSNGEGVKKDKKQAVKWYRKAAEQGDASAQNNLGVMYSNGEGVKKDKKQAVKWYRKAAEQGHAMAQKNLGLMYEYGRGGLQINYPTALSWYKKAQKNGYSGINKHIRRVLKK